MFKVNNKNSRTTSTSFKKIEVIWSAQTISLQFFKCFSNVSIADFEQVNVSWKVLTEAVTHKCFNSFNAYRPKMARRTLKIWLQMQQDF